MIYKMKKKSEINISIVILNFNSHEFTINCLKSIELSIDKYLEFEIIVVDNGSNISDFKLLNQKIEKNSYKQNIKVLRNKTNLGFGGGNMIGAKESIGKYIAFINNDTLLLNNCFNILFCFLVNLFCRFGATIKFPYHLVLIVDSVVPCELPFLICFNSELNSLSVLLKPRLALS